jgi:hypothetical protein
MHWLGSFLDENLQSCFEGESFDSIQTYFGRRHYTHLVLGIICVIALIVIELEQRDPDCESDGASVKNIVAMVSFFPEIHFDKAFISFAVWFAMCPAG